MCSSAAETWRELQHAYLSLLSLLLAVPADVGLQHCCEGVRLPLRGYDCTSGSGLTVWSHFLRLRLAVMPAVVVRQRKPWRRKDGVFIYFEDNAGVIVNPKGEMKGAP